jgi:hypothetical protein
MNLLVFADWSIHSQYLLTTKFARFSH